MSYAPALFVLLWSSSFIASKEGLRHLSPLLFVAVRLGCCALLLLGLMAVLRTSGRRLGRSGWLHCGIAGALLNAVGLMAPHVALVRTPAAQIALVQSLTPLFTAALGVLLLRERLRARQWLGSALGVGGVALVVGQAALQASVRFRGLSLALLGVCGLVAGTLYLRRYCRDLPWLAATAAQFVGAAIAAGLGAWWLETPHADWRPATLAAVAWNTVFVSMGGMGLYYLMLKRGTAARATANFYLVPGLVALLAWLFLGESLTPVVACGIVIASLGCGLVARD